MKPRTAKAEPVPAPGLQSYAVADSASRGRRHAEEVPPGPPFEFDRHRILHSTSFRRLMHKTQVFVTHEGDHYRTRLTHTLEVVAYAQRIARALGLNVALAGGVALAHDLGHPPFGHAGEQALAELMKPHEGFEHNVQSLRVVDFLEHPYPAFRGLNLSFELREGIIKHSTMFDHPVADMQDAATRELFSTGPLAPLEGQAANVADVIAYTVHDIEDGLMQQLIDEPGLNESALWRQAAEPIRAKRPDLPIAAIRRPILDQLGSRLATDAANEATKRLQAARPKSVDGVRRASESMIRFSKEMEAPLAELHGVLKQHVYRSQVVARMDARARRMIKELFAAYVDEPVLLPPRYYERIGEQPAERVVCDYIAGMTDRFCRRECARLFDPDFLS